MTWPARASSGAVPPPVIHEDDDAVVRAGKLWEQHCVDCPFCKSPIAGCELGLQAYSLYVWLADREGR